MLWIPELEIEGTPLFQNQFRMNFMLLFGLKVKILSFSAQTLPHPLIEK